MTTLQQTPAQRLVGDLAPKLAALVTNGSTAQLRSDMTIGKQNGLTEIDR